MGETSATEHIPEIVLDEERFMKAAMLLIGMCDRNHIPMKMVEGDETVIMGSGGQEMFHKMLAERDFPPLNDFMYVLSSFINNGVIKEQSPDGLKLFMDTYNYYVNGE